MNLPISFLSCYIFKASHICSKNWQGLGLIWFQFWAPKKLLRFCWRPTGQLRAHLVIFSKHFFPFILKKKYFWLFLKNHYILQKCEWNTNLRFLSLNDVLFHLSAPISRAAHFQWKQMNNWQVVLLSFYFLTEKWDISKWPKLVLKIYRTHYSTF